MRKVTEELIEFLTLQPLARERENKDKAFASMLKRKFNQIQDFPIEFLAQLFREYTNYDREWRNLLMRRPEFRGTDYPKKAQLEKVKLEELGYIIEE